MTLQTFVPTFPAFPTLANAIYKCRKLTASTNNFQITDAQIVMYMNSFYTYDLPAKYRSLKLKDFFTFTTQQGVAVYPFNSEIYTTVEMPCYVNNRETKIYFDPWNFYGVNFNWQQGPETFATGTSTTGPYNGYTIGKHILPSSNNDPGPMFSPSLYFPQGRVQNILITVNIGYMNTLNVTDDGAGNLIEIVETNKTPQTQSGWTYYRNYYRSSGQSPTPMGTINYQTGQISNLYFSKPVPQGACITIAYNTKTLSIPLAMLFYQNQITMAPVPDRGYTVQITAYRSPTKALLAQNLSGNPELSEWWEILAVGAAKKIYEDRLDSDGVMFIDKMLKERYDIIETRTYAEIGSRQIYTIYTDQVTQNYSGNGFGAYFGGP
jgi:hypothetical protein